MMNAFRNVLLALTAMVCLTGSVLADPPPGFEFYGAFPDAATATRIAELIRNGNDARYDDAFAETAPHPVTNSYGVYARPRNGGGGDPKVVVGGVVLNVNGTIAMGNAFDRIRANCHATSYNVTLQAGRTYTIDMTSGNGLGGPGFFDTWLRLEDAAGNEIQSNDDGGEGLNSRIVFTPTVNGTYRLVATTYRQGATGNFTLTVR